MLLAAEHVVTGPTPDVAPRTVEIADRRVVAVHDGIMPGAEVVDGWIVPGYVDVHSHGAAGVSFADPDTEAVQAGIAYMRAHGTTSLFASLVSAEIDVIVAQIGRVKSLVAAGELAGVHVEGPFLALDKRGAHDAAVIRDPQADAVAQVVAACAGIPSQITLAPELPGGLDAIRACVAGGMVAAFGHSDGDDEWAQAAIEAGATNVTHLFNAMRGIHHRRPGPVPVLLSDDRVMVELVCDGVHLALGVAELAVRVAGWNRVALVTDAMNATGQDDGDYLLGSLHVVVRDGVARLVTTDGTPGAIAGSTLTMDRAVMLMVAQGLPLAEVAVMASSTPARWLGLSEVGVLAPGHWADACVVAPDGALQRVLRRGDWVS